MARVNITNRPKVLINSGNGTAGLIAPNVFRAAGCDVVELNTEPDSTFPHYVPNPSVVELMEDTGAHTMKANAAI